MLHIYKEDSVLVTQLVISERDIERRLVAKAKAAGGQALKWVSPGQAGVPDRIVLFPNGRIVFVELKSPRGKLSAIQVRVIERLRNLGFEVRVIDSKEGVDALFA
jgi:hypothetical protein